MGQSELPLAGGYEYTGERPSKAGAGRGFLNPKRLDQSDDDYVSPKEHYQMGKQRIEAEENAAQDKARQNASSMKSGGTASSRGDGIAQRGKTKGTLVMCGGGMAKK
jgi:hypothetical protein